MTREQVIRQAWPPRSRDGGIAWRELFSEVVVVGSGERRLDRCLGRSRSRGTGAGAREGALRRPGGNSRFTGGSYGLLKAAWRTFSLGARPDRGRNRPPGSGTVLGGNLLDDIMRLSEGKADPALTRVLVDNSYQTVRWMQSLGVSFELYQTAVRQEVASIFPLAP